MKTIILVFIFFLFVGLLGNYFFISIDNTTTPLFGGPIGYIALFSILTRINISKKTNKYGLVIILIPLGIIQTIHFFYFYYGTDISHLLITILMYWFIVIILYIPHINFYIQKIFNQNTIEK